MILVEDALLPWRKKALSRFEQLGSKIAFPEAAAPVPTPVETSSSIVFVDGYLRSAPKDCLPLQDALKSYGLFLQNRWAKPTDNPLIALNAALAQGAFLYIPHSHHTLHVHHILTTEKLASPRLQITLGKSASVTLTQTYEYRAPNTFCNLVLDLALEANSHLELFDIQIAPESAKSYTTVKATLKKDTSLKVFHGTDNSNFSCTAEMLEPNSAFQFKALCMLTGERKAHITALADHAAPHCTSHQHVKMALNGNSRSHFDGKIYVHSPAQKTESYQLNNNLLLSKTATAITEPNLEIFADDVKASHGATVAKLSDEELFYLRARGIPAPEAKTLLTHAFCRELIDTFPKSLQPPLLEAMERTIHA